MSLYDELFSSNEMESILSEESSVKAMLEFEAALAMAEARTGVIPGAAATTIAEQCRSGSFDVGRLRTQAALAGNVAIPLVKMLTEAVAKEDAEAARFVHWGATSQDVIDTGFLLQAREALVSVEKDLGKISVVLAATASTHRKTVMAGRTWMQQALPTTFGFVAAGWLDAILRQRKRLEEIRPRVFALQFGGAVGTLAALRGDGPEVARALAAELKLALPQVPWHAERDRLAELATFLGVLTGTLGKIARDISLQAQTEVGELSEPVGEGRGGSSTMPHKRNPVTCSVVLAAAARVPGLVSTLLGAMPQEQQRGLGGWHAEWETLSGILRLAGGALHHLTAMLPFLEVDTERMQQNLEATRGLIFAEAVTMALGERIGKRAAHELVEAACKNALTEKQPLQEVLRRDSKVADKLGAADLERLFDAREYLGSAEEFVERVTGQLNEFTQKN